MEYRHMHKKTTVALLAAAGLGIVLSAQPFAAHAKIVCWKDKSGKVIGCGDSVPPEYQDSAIKELDKRGMTRKTTDSVQDVARQRVQSEEAAKAKAESDRRAAEQKRQDNALLNTFSNEAEIEAKRDRDLQALESQLGQLRVSLKNAADRQKDAKSRLDAAEKAKKGGIDPLKDDAAKAAEETKRLEQSIAAKEKEKEDVRARYAEYRKRYTDLKGTSTAKK
jgi:chromosome segregation ATPase